MKREHVYSKCIRCGWRQNTSTVSGNISFEEYYCGKCGDQLLICVDVHNAKDRNKNKKDDVGHKRQKPKTKRKTKNKKMIGLQGCLFDRPALCFPKGKHYIGCSGFAWN